MIPEELSSLTCRNGVVTEFIIVEVVLINRTALGDLALLQCNGVRPDVVFTSEIRWD